MCRPYLREFLVQSSQCPSIQSVVRKNALEARGADSREDSSYGISREFENQHGEVTQESVCYDGKNIRF